MANINETATWVDNIYLIDPEDPVQGGENGIDNLPHKQLAQRTLFLKNTLDGYKKSNDKAVKGLQQSLDGLEIPADSSADLTQLKKDFNAHKTASKQTDNELRSQINGLNIPPDLSNELAAETKDREAADNALRGNAPEEINLGSLLEKIKKLEDRPAVAIPVGGIFETTKAYKTGAELAKDIGYGAWKRFAEGKVTVGVSTKSSDPAWTKAINKTFGEYEHQLTIEEMPSHTHAIHLGNSGGGRAVDTNAHWFDERAMEPEGGDQPHNNVQPSVVVGKWVRTA